PNGRICRRGQGLCSLQARAGIARASPSRSRGWMGQLDGKVVLVTGAARGLGECVARAAVARGAHVLLTDVTDERGTHVADELGPAAHYRHLDVRDEGDWGAAVEAAETRFGHLDVLVNNAAILRAGSLETFSVNDFREVVEVNEIGP